MHIHTSPRRARTARTAVAALIAAAGFLPLIPEFGVAAGYLIGERLGVAQWLGAIAIVAATAAIAARHRGCVLVTGPSSDGTTATHRDEGESS